MLSHKANVAPVYFLTVAIPMGLLFIALSGRSELLPFRGPIIATLILLVSAVSIMTVVTANSKRQERKKARAEFCLPSEPSHSPMQAVQVVNAVFSTIVFGILQIVAILLGPIMWVLPALLLRNAWLFPLGYALMFLPLILFGVLVTELVQARKSGRPSSPLNAVVWTIVTSLSFSLIYGWAAAG